MKYDIFEMFKGNAVYYVRLFLFGLVEFGGIEAVPVLRHALPAGSRGGRGRH